MKWRGSVAEPFAGWASWFRRRAASFLSLSVLAAALPAGAQSSPPANGFPDIQVDLSARIFTSVLPFDVPFLIHGQVPLATTRVEVYYIGARRPFRVCDPGVRTFQSQAAGSPSASCPVPDRIVCYSAKRGGGEDPFDCAWQPERTGPITWVQQLPPEPGATTATFRMAIPPLEASSYYAFKFVLDRKLTADELAQLQASVRQAADLALAGNTGTVATEADNKAVRTALVAKIQALGGANLQVDRNHQILDPRVPFEQLSEADKLAFSQHIGGVVRSQHDREQQLTLRSDKQVKLEHRLAAIAESGGLDRLIARLRAQAASGQPGNAILAEHLKRHEPALALADLSPQQRGQQALGVPPADAGAPPPDLGAARKPVEAAPYVAGYQDTAERLADLRDWLDTQLKEGEGGADVAELRTLLDTTVDATDLAEQLTEHARSVQESLADREAALDALAAATSAKAAEADLLLSASSLGDFKTQQGFYISADFGMAFGPDLDKVVPYLGTNIYFRPVNKNAPLRSRSSLGRRLALTIGLTVKSIADEKPQTRSDLFDSNSLLVGLGYRVTDSARLGAGVLVFNELNRNPLLGGQKVTYSPYLSLSFDIDVLSFFRGFGSIFPGNP